MPRNFHKFMFLISLMACGAKTEQSRLLGDSFEPDNTPVHSECWGLSGLSSRPVAAEWDDQSELRICMVLQNDGGLGFDIKLRSDSAEAKRRAVSVELTSPNGRSSTAIYPLLWNPFNGVYELQLSQSCLVGQPGGCAQKAPDAMRELFQSLPRGESDWRPNVKLELSLIVLESRLKGLTERKQASSSRKIILNWPDQGRRPGKQDR